MSDDLVVSDSVRIPRGELVVTFSASGGPGGQHANRSQTRVDLTFDAAASAAFSAEQRERVVGRLGPVIRVSVDDERSQHRNRLLAEERLAERVRAALVRRRRRRPTRPTAASQRRRLDRKSRRGELKRQRRRPTAD